MKTAILCFSENGLKLAEGLAKSLDGETTVRFKEHDNLGTLFKESDALIFICAAGIAVRLVAPYLESKTTDPAVLVIDDQGRHVISLLSGHIGGANALAKEIAGRIGAEAVITTATDGAGKFSCDAWAATHGCSISSMETAKKISAAILERDIPISSEYELPGCLPNGLVKGDSGDLGIYIGIKTAEPYRETLRLVPSVVTVGIGCKRGTEAQRLIDAVKEVLKDNEIDEKAIDHIASIDIKKDEEGLLACADYFGVPTAFYSAEVLNDIQGEFDESDFVKEMTGVGNVCERAAVAQGGRLIVGKTTKGGITVAVSVKDRRIEF